MESDYSTVGNSSQLSSLSEEGNTNYLILPPLIGCVLAMSKQVCMWWVFFFTAPAPASSPAPAPAPSYAPAPAPTPDPASAPSPAPAPAPFSIVFHCYLKQGQLI